MVRKPAYECVVLHVPNRYSESVNCRLLSYFSLFVNLFTISPQFLLGFQEFILIAIIANYRVPVPKTSDKEGQNLS